MSIQRGSIHLGALFFLATAQSASAQFNMNPPVAAPYARPTISSYLYGGKADPLSDFNMGTLRQFDTRNPMLRPDVFGQYFIPRYEQPSGDYIQTELLDRFIAERNPKVSPTGFPTGFMITNPYFSGPAPGAYIPWDPRAPFNPYPARLVR
jgi:hypothetical protein